MLIDWFTVIAQTINFLILVGLLKYFLYDRILHAMDERERKIASQLLEAEAKKMEAGQEAETHRQKIQELEEQRHEMLAQAKNEADVRRKELIQQAREEVDEIRERWHDSVEQEKRHFLQDLRQRTVMQVYGIARHALKDLANAELEQRLTEVFLEQLQKPDIDKWKMVTESIREGKNTIVVQSAFEIPVTMQHKIIQVLQERLSEQIHIGFETVPDIICGIAVKGAGYTMAWGLEHYLESLEEHVSKAFDEEIHGNDQEKKVLEDKA